MPAVGWSRRLGRGTALGGDGDVDGPTVTVEALDEAAAAHPGQLVVEAALLPRETPAELVGALLALRRLGERDEHGVVGVREAAVGLEVLFEAAAQHLLHLVERPPGGVSRSLRGRSAAFTPRSYEVWVDVSTHTL